MKYIKKFKNYSLNEGEEFNYMLLSKMQSDCEFFLNYGRGNVKNLHYDSIEEHISEMKKLWEKLPIKPEWLSYEQIEDYEKRMLEYKK